jgi:enterochelin esterase family protein
MSFAFVAHESAAARHEDYTCNDRYARFIADDLLKWATSRLSSIRTEGNVVYGLSLSGLASAYIALTFPQVFSSSLCQSGSFWWNKQQFVALARDHSPIPSRYWLSVGDEETERDVVHPPTDMHQGISQIDGVQSAVDELEAGGAEVRHHLFSGGHDFGPWGDELCDALQWLKGAA